MTQNELAEKVRNLKSLMQMREELEAKIEAGQDEIKAEMTACGVDEMAIDIFQNKVGKGYQQQV